MNPKHVGTRDGRALLLGAGVVALAWISTRVVPRLAREHEALLARTEASVRQLEAARRVLAEEAWVRDSLAERGRRLVSWAPRLVAGNTRAEATAELQSLMTGLADQHRVRMVRVQPVEGSGSALFVQVRLRVEAQGDIGGLAQWLQALEEGDRLLTIPELAITAPEPAAPGGQPETLRAELVIAGWAAPKARRE